MNALAKRLISAVTAAGLTLVAMTAAVAHPHVLPAVEAKLVFGRNGHLTAIHYSWLYDVAYSTFAGRDIDVNKDGKFSKEELLAFAKTQADALAESSYFTSVKTSAGSISFAPADVYDAEARDDGRIKLSFSIHPKVGSLAEKNFTIELFDPNFFAYFTMAADAVQLVEAPSGCARQATGPQPIDLKNTKVIPAAFWQALDGSAAAATQFVSRITVTCP